MLEARQSSLLVDGQGVVRMATSAAAALFGSSPSDLEGLRLDELLEFPTRPVIEAILADLEGAGSDGPHRTSFRAQARYRGAAGLGEEADLHVVHVPGSESGKSRYLVTIDPVAAADLGSVDPVVKEEVTEGAVFLCRGDRLQQAGAGLAEMVGVGQQELRGWRVQNLVAAEDLLPVMQILRELEQGMRPAAEFGFHLLRSGERPPLEVAARARRIRTGRGETTLVGLRDISASLKAARGAAEHLGRLDAALAASPGAVLIVGEPDNGSRVLLANRAFDDLFGIESSKWVGRSFWRLWKQIRGVHEEPRRQETRLRRLLRDPREPVVETVLTTRPARRVLERYAGPLRSASDGPAGVIFCFRDVTAQVKREKRLERLAGQEQDARRNLERLHEELALANEGLEKRLAEMSRLNKDLKVLDQMKSNLLANVSHELQTPLVSIKGFTEMILKGRLGGVTAEQEKGLQVALRNINRLIGLIDNLLAFARTQEESAPLKLTTFPLEEVVSEAVALVEDLAREKKVSLRAHLPGEGFQIHADRDKILQVMLNLVTNAIKYNRPGGEVSIEADQGRDGTARVDVKDTGIGIPREAMDKIFDRYFQAANAGKKGQAKGTGIGLSITKNILRQHGCMIRVDSEEGKGSVFSFTLPIDRKSRGERPSSRIGMPEPLEPGDPSERVPETSHDDS